MAFTLVQLRRRSGTIKGKHRRGSRLPAAARLCVPTTRAGLAFQEIIMGRVCRTCSRVNPPEAFYCYYDGVVLDGHALNDGPIAVGAQPFLTPFVFPSGRACRNFDELVLACDTEWS